jgi:hypothetical protein
MWDQTISFNFLVSATASCAVAINVICTPVTCRPSKQLRFLEHAANDSRRWLGLLDSLFCMSFLLTFQFTLNIITVIRAWSSQPPKTIRIAFDVMPFWLVACALHLKVIRHPGIYRLSQRFALYALSKRKGQCLILVCNTRPTDTPWLGFPRIIYSKAAAKRSVRTNANGTDQRTECGGLKTQVNIVSMNIC